MAWAVPVLALALFVVALFALLRLVQHYDEDAHQATARRDAQWVEQTVRAQLVRNEGALQQLAAAMADGRLDVAVFRARAATVLAQAPEIERIAWVDAGQTIRWVAPNETVSWRNGERLAQGPQRVAFQLAVDAEAPAYSEVFVASGSVPVFEVHVPVRRGGKPAGNLVAVCVPSSLLVHHIPAWFTAEHRVDLVGADGGVVAANSTVPAEGGRTAAVAFDPPVGGLSLRVTAMVRKSEWAPALLTGLVLALALLLGGSLWSLRHRVVQRRGAEQTLRREMAFRRAMEESVVTGLRAIDLEGRITFVNAAFCRMVGFPAETLLGCRPPFPYWPPEDHDKLMAAVRETLAGRAPPKGYELQVMRANGERFWVRLYVSPLIDADGRQAGWMAAMNDITEPVRARAELLAAHERFVAVLDGLDAAVYVADARDDTILYANGVFRARFGEDAVGRNCWALTACCHPGPQALLRDPRSLSPQDLPRELLDAEVDNRDTGRWYHLRDRAIRWVDGRVVRMVIATDITERTQIAAMNQQHQERLERTSRLIAMGEMASSLAHELNQPLSAVANYCMGCVTRLESGSAGATELAAAMRKAAFQAERAGKIIRRVREFVRKSEPQRLPTALGEMVEDAVAFADLEARKTGTRIQVDLPTGLPPVYADRIMIEQVLLNLVQNGIEAMGRTPRERRELTIAARPVDGAQVEVEVRDRGPGVDPAHTERLFQPFFTTKPQGMGMGLNICRSIVEFHDGRLWARANPEGGSSFLFTLPLHD
ncbi:MAG: PAS domain S-box protein [Betaproteobacteria bacterium]|nr:PAS domain S-box protein [Betaproteobacteria bacterium]